MEVTPIPVSALADFMLNGTASGVMRGMSSANHNANLKGRGVKNPENMQTQFRDVPLFEPSFQNFDASIADYSES